MVLILKSLGLKSIKCQRNRWRAAYNENRSIGTYEIHVKKIQEDQVRRELTLEEKYARLEAQNQLLKAENELLKKIRYDGKGAEEEISYQLNRSFILIRSVIEKYNLKKMVSYLM